MSIQISKPTHDEPEAAVDSSASVKSTPSLLRALIIGLLLIPVNVFWITIIEVRWYTLDGTSLPLFVTPIFFLFVLTVANLWWRKQVGVSKALRQEELLLIYIILQVSCAFAGADTFQNLFGVIGAATWYATPENGWEHLFFQYLPKWLLITDHETLAKFYQGGVSIYSPQGMRYLAAWIIPLTAWGIFFLTLYGMYLCLNILLRQAWIRDEKLTFPIVQLPIAMTSDDAGTAFFKNPIMWAGFGVAFGIAAFNGLHQLYPAMPQISVTINDIQGKFTTPPWNFVGRTLISFYPFAIGIAYFMPLDLSLSCWSFYILARLFRVAGAQLGYSAEPDFPYFPEQAVGAWLALGVILIYSGRHKWAAAFREARLGLNSADPAEGMRYRYALIGLIVGIVLLGVFSAMIGMSWYVALAFFALVLFLGFVITRIRAEFGAPHEIYWVNPGQVLVTLFGPHMLGAQSLTLLSTLYWFNRCYRNHPMPNQLEAFKMMDGRKGVKFGGLVGAMCIAAVVSLLTTYWANLHVTYAAGALAKANGFKWWAGTESFGNLQNWLTDPNSFKTSAVGYIVGAFLFVVGLSILRMNFEWWPLHPAGYALAISFAMEYFWLPVFIAWLAKAVILRYGGSRMYRLAIPFFLGLILGDYTGGALWAIIGPIMGVPTYKIFI